MNFDIKFIYTPDVSQTKTEYKYKKTIGKKKDVLPHIIL